MANDQHRIVLTRESGTADGKRLNWTGVHMWTFRNGRCSRLVAYADADYQRFWASGP